MVLAMTKSPSVVLGYKRPATLSQLTVLTMLLSAGASQPSARVLLSIKHEVTVSGHERTWCETQSCA